MAEQLKKNNHRKKALIAMILGLLVAGGTGYYLWTKDRVTTDDAFVDGHIFTITPRVSGYVTKVHARDNQRVKKGDLLSTLDPTQYEVTLAEAKAALAEAEATLASLELGVPLEVTQTAQRVRGAQAQLESLRKTLERVLKEEEAQAQEVKGAQAQYEQSLIDLRRIRELAAIQAAPQSALDAAQTAVESGQARVGAARARMESIRKQKASLESDMDGLKANIALAATGEDLAVIKAKQVVAQKARVELARARVRQAELELDYTNITSPSEGFVTRKRVEPGLMVSKGQPLMAVVPLSPERLWITANYKETQLTRVKKDQRVTIRVDAYPAFKFRGMVDSIMAGTGSVFSLFPPENATGNFVKVVQRVPVKITLDQEGQEDLPTLRIGMSVVPTIFTDRD